MKLKQLLEPSQTLAEQALQRLTEDIAYLRWAPQARLNIESLKRAYVMGGTPIREAVNQLVAVGLVEAMPLKGFQVMPLQAYSSRLCFQSRLHLEQDLFQYLLNLANDDWETQWVAAQYGLKKSWATQQKKVDLKRWCGAFHFFQLNYTLSTGVLIGCCNSHGLAPLFLSERRPSSIKRPNFILGVYFVSNHLYRISQCLLL
jgi:GntR family carbon starvation induced transcriptional regulator